MSLTNATSNFTVKWMPTPDLPRMGADTEDCTKPRADNVNSTRLGTWNETLPKGDSVCTSGNNTYVYPCCEAVGIEARFDCGFTACHIGPERENQWYECVHRLSEQQGDDWPIADCQPAKLINENLERKKAEEAPKNHAARQVPIVSFAIVVFLAAAAVIA